MLGFKLLFPLTALIGSIQAVPLYPRDDVSQQLLDRLQLMSQYAGAAYCPENNYPGSDTKVTCGTGNCPLVESAGATSLVEWQNVGVADATGFVALDHKNGLIMISFRGSRSLRNVLSTVNFILKPWSLCSWCFVHPGFYNSWNDIKPTIKSAIDGARSQYSNYTIVATGHSLGGALATVAAADLRSENYPVELYSYGAPMVGNYALANFITDQGKNYRVTHQDDPVPKLPGYPLLYAHVSNEYWIKSEDTAPVTTKDIAVSSGAINLAGSNSRLLQNDPTDHSYYFGRIGACISDRFEF